MKGARIAHECERERRPVDHVYRPTPGHVGPVSAVANSSPLMAWYRETERPMSPSVKDARSRVPLPSSVSSHVPTDPASEVSFGVIVACTSRKST